MTAQTSAPSLTIGSPSCLGRALSQHVCDLTARLHGNKLRFPLCGPLMAALFGQIQAALGRLAMTFGMGT